MQEATEIVKELMRGRKFSRRSVDSACLTLTDSTSSRRDLLVLRYRHGQSERVERSVKIAYEQITPLKRDPKRVSEEGEDCGVVGLLKELVASLPEPAAEPKPEPKKPEADGAGGESTEETCQTTPEGSSQPPEEVTTEPPSNPNAESESS